MNTTLVINPKGGAGKTTVAINLASHFAAANTATTLMDYDPQGSSLGGEPRVGGGRTAVRESIARLPAAGAVSQRAQPEAAGAPRRFRRVRPCRGNRGWNFRDGLPGVGRRVQAVHADHRLGGRPACATRRPRGRDALRAGAHPLRIEGTARPGWKSTGASSNCTTSTATAASTGANSWRGPARSPPPRVRRWRWRRRSCPV